MRLYFKHIIILVLINALEQNLIAQSIGIASTAITPDASSMLELQSTTKGFLIPRMTSAQRTAISSPASGLMTFQITTNIDLYFNTGTSGSPTWDRVLTNNSVSTYLGWKTTGNSGTTAGTNYIGTSDAVDFAFYANNAEGIRVLSTGNIGIGQPSPAAALDVNGKTKTQTFQLGTSSSIGSLLKSDASGNATWANPPYALLVDADADTKVQVEKNSNENIVRFDLAGTEYFNVTTAHLNVLNSGQSVFVGEGAGSNDDLSTNQNVFMGYNAGYTNTTGDSNVAVGHSAMYSNTDGSENTAVGFQALYSNTTGNKNSVLGYRAAYSNQTGSNNCVIGANALYSSTNLSNMVVMGKDAAYNLTAGGDGVIIGNSAAYNATSSTYDVIIGHSAAYYQQTGQANVIIGDDAGKGTANHTKNGNVLIGYQAGYQNHGDYNIFLGYQAGYNETTASNKLYIENSNSTTPLIYGEFDNDFVRINSCIGLGTSSFGSGVKVLGLGNGTAPTSSATDGVLLYAQDVSASSELKVRDEAGNITTLSPHNFSFTPKSEEMAWSFYSEHQKRDRIINVDMLKFVRLVEKMSGEKLVYIADLESGCELNTENLTSNSYYIKLNDIKQRLLKVQAGE